MPRGARIQSDSGVYHVMLRGSNRQQIFFDDEDRAYFVQLLSRVKEASGMELHGYCLMGNHIHLLIRETSEPLSTIFRRLGAAFVYWYNAKYERVGHLFQDRYKSEPVNDDAYFLTVLRYILQNPVKAGICAQPEVYAWSSAREYLSAKEGITDTGFARSLTDAAGLRQFLCEESEDACMEIDETAAVRLTDMEAGRRILKEFGTMTPAAGKPKDREGFNRSIRRLLASGISIRQLSRLTGISRRIIENSKRRQRTVPLSPEGSL